MKRWKQADDLLIQGMYKADYSISEIAQAVGRSHDATRNRLYTLRHDDAQAGFKKRQRWFDGARFGHLDIETTNFAANFGHMLSWAMYCPADTFTETNVKGGYRAAEPKDGLPGVVYFDVVRKAEVRDYDRQDKRISKSLIHCMRNHADLLVTYYGTGFDIKFMRSRALWWNQNFPGVGEKYHLDMYYRARSLLKLHRNSLDAVTTFLKIPGKDHVLGETWGRARTGDPEALKYVVNHNVEDVVILERAYERLKKYFRLTKKSI